MNEGNLLEIAVVHDLAEAIVRDITPGDNVGPFKKKRLEDKAMKHIARILGAATSNNANTTQK